VQAIEVWNEENIDREWSSTRGLKAENYISLLKDTYTAVKAIDPGVIVISGARFRRRALMTVWGRGMTIFTSTN